MPPLRQPRGNNFHIKVFSQLLSAAKSTSTSVKMDESKGAEKI